MWSHGRGEVGSLKSPGTSGVSHLLSRCSCLSCGHWAIFSEDWSILQRDIHSAVIWGRDGEPQGLRVSPWADFQAGGDI